MINASVWMIGIDSYARKIKMHQMYILKTEIFIFLHILFSHISKQENIMTPYIMMPFSLALKFIKDINKRTSVQMNYV